MGRQSDAEASQLENSAGREVRRFHQSEALKRMAEGFIPSSLAKRSMLRNVTLRSPRSIFPKWDLSMPDASASHPTLYSGKGTRLPRPEITAIAALAGAGRGSAGNAITSNIFQLALGEALIRFSNIYTANRLRLSENEDRLSQDACNIYHDTSLDLIDA